MAKTEYKGYLITFDPKPIPFRGCDFDYAHVDFDGPGDRRCGNAGSVQDCMDLIDELEDDDDEPEDGDLYRHFGVSRYDFI